MSQDPQVRVSKAVTRPPTSLPPGVRPNMRKKLLIDPRFQWSFLGYLLGATIAVAAIFFGATRLFFYRLIQKGEAIGLPADHIFFRFIGDQKVTMDYIFLGTCGVLTLTLLFFGLHLSNKIAGPVYRLKTDLKRAAELGQFRRFSVRQGDYFPELADAINDYVGATQGRQPGSTEGAPPSEGGSQAA